MTAEMPPAPQATTWIDGEYRTSATVLIAVRATDGRVLNTQNIRDNSKPNEDADTMGEWRKCRIDIDESTHEVLEVASADDKTLFEVLPPRPASYGRSDNYQPEESESKSETNPSDEMDTDALFGTPHTTDVVQALDVAEEDVPRARTLESIANEIAFCWKSWVHEKPIDLKKSDVIEFVEERVVDNKQWSKLWQDRTHVVKDAETKGGAYWYNGVEWKNDPYGEGIKTAMKHAIHEAEELIEKQVGSSVKLIRPPNLFDLGEIAGRRKKNTSYNRQKPCGEGLICSDGTRVFITPNGEIQMKKVNPAEDIWFSTLPIPSTKILEGLEEYSEWQKVAEKFPNWYNAIKACDDAAGAGRHEHAAFIASIASAVVYSTHPKNESLDIIFWGWDNQVGRTGKTTHCNLVFKAFGNAATTVSWADIIGEHSHTGDLSNIYLGYSDEATDGIIKKTDYLKSIVSGTAMHRPLYHDPMAIGHPVVLMCTANHPPKIAPIVNKEPVRRRFVCLEWTKQFQGSSAFPCSEEEAMTAILNLGLYGARECIRALHSGGVARDALPYRFDPEEMKMLSRFVAWADVLSEMVEPSPANRISLTRLRLTLIKELSARGAIPVIDETVIATGKITKKYLLSCPDLRSDRIFHDVIHGRELKIVDEYGHVKGSYQVNVGWADKDDERKEMGQYVVIGCRLINPTQLIPMPSTQERLT